MILNEKSYREQQALERELDAWIAAICMVGAIVTFVLAAVWG